MSSKEIEVNVKDLPELQEISAGDYFLVESDTTSRIDSANITWDIDNTTFGYSHAASISALETNMQTLSSEFVSLSSTLTSTILVSATDTVTNLLNSVYQVQYVLPSSAPSVSIPAGRIYAPFNKTHVNNTSLIADLYDPCGSTSSCFPQRNNLTLFDVISNTAYFPNLSAITLLQGLYKVHCTTACGTTCYTDLIQLTPPTTVLLEGSIGQTSVIDGYFYLCDNAALSLRIYSGGSNTIGTDISWLSSYTGAYTTPINCEFKYISPDNIFGDISIGGENRSN